MYRMPVLLSLKLTSTDTERLVLKLRVTPTDPEVG
jgi:hypothetical protein